MAAIAVASTRSSANIIIKVVVRPNDAACAATAREDLGALRVSDLSMLEFLVTA
jgi:hypothetical protein